MISIVCPFFNEEAILEASVRTMLENLETLPDSWELIIVNDGSTDGSLDIARSLAQEHPSLKVISYAPNRGRGHALLTGIRAARGELVYTTEIDSSWGERIVHAMHQMLSDHPEADMVIASPHLAGGGYRNVPLHRVLLSRYGNYLIRAGLSFRTTMNTGMTRGYRREAILRLPLFEHGKEFHLEVVLKAMALGMQIVEVPAVLEWKKHKHQGRPIVRKSSSKIARLMRSHLLFSAVVAPIRYLWAASALVGAVAVSSGVYACLRRYWHEPYANAILGFAGFSMLSVLLFSLGVISEQNRLLTRDLWRIQSHMKELQKWGGRQAGREPSDDGGSETM